jgi:predicted GNAT family acetyltransferase
MPVVRHTDPGAFLAAAQPVISRNEASSAAFAAWIGAIAAQPAATRDVTYLATYDDGGSYGAALRRADGPVVVEDTDPPAAHAFAEDLASSAPQLQGIVGSLPACEAFARTWRACTGRVHALRFHLRHHMLVAVDDVPAAPGAPRVAGSEDGDWLIASQRAFLTEAGVVGNPERVLAAMPRRIECGEYWIWDDRACVAFAGWSDAGAAAARIAPVYTPPELRGRGYATALVAALARALLGGGKARLFLVTDVANPTSNSIYARVGFRPVTDIFHFDFIAPK